MDYLHSLVVQYSHELKKISHFLGKALLGAVCRVGRQHAFETPLASEDSLLKQTASARAGHCTLVHSSTVHCTLVLYTCTLYPSTVHCTLYTCTP